MPSHDARNADYRSLTPRQRDIYQRVARGITESRWSGRNPRDTLLEMGTTLETGLLYAPEAFERRPDGSYRVRGTDTLVRRVRMITSTGVETVQPQNSQAASEIARYDNAVEAFLGGNPYPLRSFRRKRLRLADGRRVPFFTDEEELLRLGRRGELSFESFYPDGG